MQQVFFAIFTNSDVNQAFGLKDDEGNWLELDADATYRSAFKYNRDDAEAVITFATSDEDGVIEIIDDTDDNDVDYQAFWFHAPQSVVADLQAGRLIADLIQVTDSEDPAAVPEHICEFTAAIIEGVTPA